MVPISPPAFAAPSELQGEWTGTVRMYDGSTTPIALMVKSDDVHVKLGGEGALWTVLNGPSFNGKLSDAEIKAMAAYVSAAH